MEQDKISIIVPVYNAQGTIEKCVRSILSQSYTNIEVILVDDGSKDNSLEVCNKLSLEDRRIVVLNQENMGVSAARNNGLKFATGEFVQFVDADDYIDKLMCEKLIGAIKKYKADVVVCGYNKISFNRVESKKGIQAVVEGIENLEETFSKAFERALFNAPWNKLYKKDLIKEEFNTKLSLGEDLIFNLSYFANCYKFVFIEDRIYNYTNCLSDNLSKKYDDDLLNLQLGIYKSAKEFCIKNFKGNIGIDAAERVFEKEVYYYIKKLILKSGYMKKDKLKKIKQCICIPEIKERLKDIKSKDTQIKILFVLLKYNLTNLIYLFFYLKSILKGDGL